MRKYSNHKVRQFAARLLLPAIIGLSSVGVELFLWNRLIAQQSAKVQAATGSDVLFVKNKIESELDSRILSLEQLARRWQVRGEPDAVDWNSDGVLVMSGSRGLQAVEWVDPMLRVIRVTPRRQNGDEFGLSFQSDERRRVVLQAVINQQVTMVSRSVDLKTGGRGFLVCVPVFSNGKFEGAVVGVFNYANLLDPVLREVAQDNWITLYEGSEKIYSREGNSTPRAESLAMEVPFGIGQLTWKARLWPKPETMAQADSPLPTVTLVGGIQMSALLAFAVYLVESLKREIGERSRVESQLRHAAKMEAVGQLAGGVAHSFNNLLLVIRGQAQLLLGSLRFSDDLQRYPREILKASESAGSLTRQLLAFSRKQILQPRVLNLNTLVSQLVVLLPPLIGADIELVLSLAPTLASVRADPGQLEQVIMNLVVNARDAMPDGGKLMIQTENGYFEEGMVEHADSPQRGVILTVSDNGCGMDEETRSRIFEPFFSTKEKNKGTGLGLSMVYGTVEQSGGSMKVTSEPKRGTTIQIWLPPAEEDDIEAAAVPDPKDAPEVASPAAVETVLLVEDEKGVRYIAREFLKMNNYTVLEAQNADEAIRIAQEYVGPIHLMLTDIVMPGLKGEELAERITSIRPFTRVLYMSAYTEDAILNLGMLPAGTNFIEKPFSPEDLARKVRAVLESVQG